MQALLDRFHPDFVFGRFLGSVNLPIIRSLDDRRYEFEVGCRENFGNARHLQYSARTFGCRLAAADRMLSYFVRFVCVY